MIRNLFWRLLAFITLILAAGQHAKALPPDTDHIYLVNFNDTNFSPVKENEKNFQKLFLTSPGVFEGDVTFFTYLSTSYFRFYSMLQDNNNFDWSIGNIGPLEGGDSDLTPLGASRIYRANNVCDKTIPFPFGDTGGTWVLPEPGDYHIKVDLNNGTMELMPLDEVFVILGTPSAPPAEDEYANQRAFSTFKEYIEPGSLCMSFYSPSKKSWMKMNLKNTGLKEEYSNSIESFESCSSPSPFKLDNWPGGIFDGQWSLSNNGRRNYFYLKTDDVLKGHITADELYYTGGSNYWNFYRRIECEKLDDNGKLFKVFIHKGTDYFKIIVPEFWNDLITLGFGGSIKKNESGDFVMQLRNNQKSENIIFDSPTENDYYALLDLDDLTLTIPADAPLSEYEEIIDTPEYSDRMYISYPENKDVEIYEDASAVVRNQYQYLEKVDDNTWKTETRIYGRFNFVYKLTPKGEPNLNIVPSTDKDMELVFNDGYAYAFGTLSETPAYWLPDEAYGNMALITVTKEGDNFKVAIDSEATSHFNDKIYLIGAPNNGWDINSPNMPLRRTDKGGYYGAFDIPKGEAMFRFYTSLGDWDWNSIGAQRDDNPLNFEMNDDGSLKTNCVMGKGSWSFPEWPGGTMYIYVDLSTMIAEFSDHPIENVGNILANVPRQPMKEGVFGYTIENPQLKEFEETAPGVFHYSTVLSANHSGEMLLFSRKLPISPEEKEWKGSYTISLQGDGVIDFKEKHYAEFDIVLNNEIGTQPATPLSMKIRNPHDFQSVDIVVDLNEMKLYVADFGSMVVVPAGEPTPDAKSAPLYEDRIIWDYTGGVVDIPAGKFDVWFSIFDYNKEPANKQIVSFKDEPYQICENINRLMGWQVTGLSAPDWHGGKVFIDRNSVFDLSSVESVKVFSNNGEEVETGVLYQTAPGSMVFKGTTKFTVSDKADNFYMHGVGLVLAEKTIIELDVNGEEREIYFSVTAGAPCGQHPTLDPPQLSEQSLIFPGDEPVISNILLGCGGFEFPNLSGDYTLEITLDLNDMTIEARVTEGSSRTTYTVVAEEGTMLDGLQSYVCRDGNNFLSSNLYFNAPNNSNNENVFNLLTNHDSIIVPEGGESVNIEFNEMGIWSGKFMEIPADIPSGASSYLSYARKAARQNAGWCIELPEDSECYIQMLVDETQKTLTVFSVTHNKCFIIEQETQNTTLADIIAGKADLLMPTDTEDVWKGTFDLFEGSASRNILFSAAAAPSYSFGINNYTNGVGWLADNDIFDFSSGNDSITRCAWDRYKITVEGKTRRYYASNWKLQNAKSGRYEVVYDGNVNLISVTRISDTPGLVINPEMAVSTPEIIPGYGEVSVIASQPAQIDFFSISGILVKSVNVAEGVTVIRMPAGLYVANRKKICVK